MISNPTRDRQTVLPDGSPIGDRIAGVRIRPAVTQEDDRGTICEIFSALWDFDTAPLVYAYQVTIRPHKIKGWVIHEEQDDRLFFSSGSLRVVLFDARRDSSTNGEINELYFSDYNRGLLRIPRGVYHAIQNIGETDALFINLPTQPYNHAAPDKARLPLDTNLIPYRFVERQGR